MDTNAALRQRALRLVKLGVNQKVLAGKMGLSESQFSRWINKKNPRPLPLPALDGFNEYVEAIRIEAGLDPATLTEAENEQLQAEAMARDTEQTIKRKERAAARKRRQRRPGRRFARK